MVDVMTAFMLVEHAGAATARPPQGRPGYQRILNSERRPQRTKDGWISVLPYTRANFEDIFRAGDREDLANDERIHSARARLDHADALYREVAAILTQRSTLEWLDFCQAPTCPPRPFPPSSSWLTPCRRRPPRGRPLQGDPPAGPVLEDVGAHGPTASRPQWPAHR